MSEIYSLCCITLFSIELRFDKIESPLKGGLSYCDSGGTRTPNLWYRKPILYPVELRSHLFAKLPFTNLLCSPIGLFLPKALQQ